MKLTRRSTLGMFGAAIVSPRLTTPIAIAGCCLAGSLIGASLGAWEVAANGGRAGAGNNPIHFSGLVVILGFCALPGNESPLHIPGQSSR